MLDFMQKKVYLQGILLHYFLQKKSSAEAHRIHVENYNKHTLSETTCRDWFRCFKNNDFGVEDKECTGAPRKFEDKDLAALLHEDSYQVQAKHAESLAVLKHLKALGIIQKQGHWVPYELKPRDVEWCLVTYE